MPRLRTGALVVVAGVFGILSTPAPTSAQAGRSPPPSYRAPQDAPGHVPGRVIVKYRRTARASARSALLRAAGSEPVKRLSLIDAEVVTLPEGWSVPDAVAWYSARPEVAYAEPDRILHAIGPPPALATTPDDPRFSDLWGLDNTGQTGGTADADIDAPEAWDLITDAGDIVVGVIDTGVDTDHEDLATNIWTNPGETPGNGIDDDGNGYVDDVQGWDFVNDDNDPFDDNGHGTHVSGTIAAAGNNGTGVTGVAWQAQIMALKFLASDGSGLLSDAILAVEYATVNGADLTNNSWGCFGSGCFSQALRDAIEAAGDAGDLFVAAAGNNGADIDVTPTYPASFTLDNIVSVAATDHNDALAGFSNFGLTSVDLGAPGVSILSSLPNDTYGFFNGTSMASPHVAGAVALLWAQFPGLTHLEIRDRILASGDPIAALDGKTVTGRRLNVFNAMEDDQTAPAVVTDLAVVPDAAAVVRPLARTALSLEWTAPGDDGEVGTASSYDVRYSTQPIDETTFETANPAGGEPSPGPAGTTESFTVQNLEPETQYFFALRTLDNVGNQSDLSNVASGETDDVFVVFSDDAETDASEDLWTADPPWGRTSADASPDGSANPTGGSFSWTDSPSSNYGNNQNVSLTSISFSLAEATNSALLFDHRFSIEENFDFGRVEISTDGGSSWTELASYTGVETNWAGVAFDLAAYDGEADVSLRFRLTTDASVISDGWYIDDVRVVADPTSTVAVSGATVELGTDVPASLDLELENQVAVAGVDYEIQWLDELGFVSYEGSGLTDRTTGFTHSVEHDAAGNTLTGVLIEPGGGVIDAGTGPILEHQLLVSKPANLEETPVSGVEVEAPADPNEGMPRIFVPVPFDLVETTVSDVDGNPVAATVEDGILEVEILNTDVDFSGDVAVADVVTMVDFFLERSELTDLQFLVADAYRNEVINVVDMVRSINIILGRPIGTGSVDRAIAASTEKPRELPPSRRFAVVARWGEEGAPRGLSNSRTELELLAGIPPDVVGVQISAEIDSDRLAVSEPRLALDRDKYQLASRVGTDRAEFVIFSPSGRALPPGSRPLVVLDAKPAQGPGMPVSSDDLEVVEVIAVDPRGRPIAQSSSVVLALEELLGSPGLSRAERRFLDRMGNDDGAYNLGDFLALLKRLGVSPEEAMERLPLSRGGSGEGPAPSGHDDEESGR